MNITTILTELNTALDAHKSTLSRWAFGEDVDQPIGIIINSGLCGAYAQYALHVLGNQGINVKMVGSPTHVFLEFEGKYYDARHPEGTERFSDITYYPTPMDYSDPALLIQEFPAHPEGYALISGLLPSTQFISWLHYLDE